LRPNQIARLGIARTFQNIRLFRGLSVLDNVRAALFAQAGYPLAAALTGGRAAAEAEARVFQRAMEMLRLFDLDGSAAEPAGSLPYGAQRRLELARALAPGPRLLLLDEPAAGMNPAEADRLMERIRWVHRHFGVAILLIEHQMRVVMGLCPRLVVLDFGQIIAQGPPEAVRRDPRVLEAYLGREVGAA
ncbi:MAG TPA: ATP-binding cassette domain-containing protein, partial [Limnochordales bacterium]